MNSKSHSPMTVIIPDNKGFCLLAAINAMSESDGNNPVYVGGKHFLGSRHEFVLLN